MTIEVEGLVELCPMSHQKLKIINSSLTTFTTHVQICCDVVQMIVLSDL